MSGVNEVTKLNDFLIYLLIGLSGFLVTLIGVIYNSMGKNIKTLFKYKDAQDKKNDKMNEEIYTMKATCKERSRKNDDKKTD